MDQGELPTFGRALELIGGSSALNPSHFINNCVSVCIAKILAYADVHEFWRSTIGTDLPDVSLSIEQTIQLLGRTGWDFSWRIYQSSSSSSDGDDSSPATRSRGFVDEPALGSYRMLVYTRGGGGGGVGHCVVSGAAAGEVDYQFVCYQQATYGADATREVQAADKAMVFYLRPPADGPQREAWLERLFRRAVERRSDPVWQSRRLRTLNNALRVLGQEQVERWSGTEACKDEMDGARQLIDASHQPLVSAGAR